MARAVAIQETNGTHYWTSGQTGTASHHRYPLRELLQEGGMGEGCGVMQLTFVGFVTRETIWDWKENIKMGMWYLNEVYGYSCAQYSEHLEGVTDEWRRLGAYTRWNLGENSRYHWWNDSGSAISSLLINASASAEQHSPSWTQLDLVVTHNVANPTSARIEDANNAPHAVNDSPAEETFDWMDINLNLGDFVSGSSEDQIDLFLGIYAWDPEVVQRRERLYEGAGSVPATAGFRPASGWAKMGYVPNNIAGNTSRYRDYNDDGVRDQAGNPYAVPNGPEGINEPRGRAPCYADQAQSRE